MHLQQLDAPTSRIAGESNLLHKSEALQLQQSSSRMSWNAARLDRWPKLLVAAAAALLALALITFLEERGIVD